MKKPTNAAKKTMAQAPVNFKEAGTVVNHINDVISPVKSKMDVVASSELLVGSVRFMLIVAVIVVIFVQTVVSVLRPLYMRYVKVHADLYYHKSINWLTKTKLFAKALEAKTLLNSLHQRYSRP